MCGLFWTDILRTWSTHNRHVIAVLAIILAFSMSSTWSSAFKNLHEKALELKPDGLWAQASEETDNGIMGIISKLPKDEASLNELLEEMNELGKETGKAD